MTATERRLITLQLEVVFRPAEQTDLPNLEWYGKYTHFRRLFQRTFEEQMAGARLMLLADVNGWPVGHVFIQLESYDGFFMDMRKRAYLYSLRVMDAFQHRGLGSALIREAEAILVGREYDTVSIAAAKDNPRARRLYERLGYHVVAEDNGRWSYVDHEGRTRYVAEPCWILEKRLRPPS